VGCGTGWLVSVNKPSKKDFTIFVIIIFWFSNTLVNFLGVKGPGTDGSMPGLKVVQTVLGNA
jgi:hypothetical protein